MAGYIGLTTLITITVFGSWNRTRQRELIIFKSSSMITPTPFEMHCGATPSSETLRPPEGGLSPRTSADRNAYSNAKADFVFSLLKSIGSVRPSRKPV
jgi:hypothetical protein